ncbi:MAG: glycosyltransferase [Luteitalea sp.]|nr:glycosyltransferase [Luteitalea sp.]
MTTVQRGTVAHGPAAPITVSAVMPAYNAAPYLKDAVDSVISQTFENWELIVIDDGSQDDTPTVLAAYRDPRIRVLRLPKNSGRGAARNAGLAVATGRYIAVCDSDDISLPHRFARQVAFLEAHPEVDVVSGHMLVFWNGSAPRRSIRFPEEPAAISRRFQRGRMGVVHGASMLRARCFSAFGRYREELVRAEDFEYFRRIHRFCRFHTLPEVLLLYRHEVTRRPWWKWVENSRCHRYANYLYSASVCSSAPVMSFDSFSRRWQGYAIDYSIELLKFVKFTTLAYVRDLRIRAAVHSSRGQRSAVQE